MQNHLLKNLPAIYSIKTTVFDITVGDTHLLSPWGLEAGEVVSYHYHDSIEIGYCFEGSGVHYTRDGEFSFQKGDALFVIPGHPHYAVSDPGVVTKWMFLYVDVESIKDAAQKVSAKYLNPKISLYEIVSPSEHPEIVQAILRIIDQYSVFRSYRNELLSLLYMELLILLGRETGPHPPCRIRQVADYGRLNPVIQHIHNNIDSGRIPKVEELAEMYYMSNSNFRKIFNEATGLAPHSYVTRFAVERVQKLLLSTDKSILDICTEVGFHSLSTLNRNFVSQCGMSPKMYRKTHRYAF